MKKCGMLLGLLAYFFPAKAQTPDYGGYPVYEGTDLGLSYSPAKSAFRIWAPTAEKAELRLYREGTGGEVMKIVPLQKSTAGTWTTVLTGNQLGIFYTFRVLIGGNWSEEVPDPYAKAVGVNGKRAMVVNLAATNPAGWEKDKSPLFLQKTSAILYELHIRDASISRSSGIKNKGKFLGLTERGTRNSAGQSTGLDHLKELGVTHVHLLPLYDFNSIDEANPVNTYNWGYDPLNYNVPEGSYSTNPYDGATRIREFKQLVKAFHENGLRVIMDVVYNHTALTEGSNFNQLVPGYYYRQDKNGKFSNATACGNETASERPMFRKFMLESMQYWVKEYHVDGFRVDLMGVHDIETMNLVSRELHKIKPDILLYGEGWTAGASPLPDSLRALKANAAQLDRIAVFSDDIRDGIKGSVFEHEDRGFASGKKGMEQSIRFGITAACRHPQVDYKKVNYSKAPYAASPSQVITYCECHDNHNLRDKLAISAKQFTEKERVEMQELALSIVLTSQGIPFLHAGSEFMRSKKGVENSYQSPDSVNAIDWDLKMKYRYVFEYVKALVELRKKHTAFRFTTADQVARALRFEEDYPEGLVAYTIDGTITGDSWKKIRVVLNGSDTDRSVPVPAGNWQVYISGNMRSDVIGGREGYWRFNAYSCTILYEP